jgi:putative membrane protein
MSGSAPRLQQQSSEAVTPITASQSGTVTADLNPATRLAIERTRIAHDRTMLAWIRTATSLITFGFTIYKLFQLEKIAGPGDRVISARGFAIIMISIGLISLLMAAVNNRQNIRMLRELNPAVPRSRAALLAALIAILGILALVSVIGRL